MSFSLPKLSISVASLLISTVAGYSATLHPTNVQVSVPAGSNDTTSPYQDDVLLKELTFGGTVFSSTDQIVSVADFEVLTGRSYINAEWGDLDTNSDGDSDPFTKAGYAGEAQETVDPTIQDTTLKQAFSSFSLSEMSDGEGSGEFSFRMTFTQSLIDNSFGLDDKPELVIFERGMNDNFDIRLILGNTGGTADYSNWIETSSRDFLIPV